MWREGGWGAGSAGAALRDERVGVCVRNCGGVLMNLWWRVCEIVFVTHGLWKTIHVGISSRADTQERVCDQAPIQVQRAYARRRTPDAPFQPLKHTSGLQAHFPSFPIITYHFLSVARA